MEYLIKERENGKRLVVHDSYKYLDLKNLGQDVLFLIREHKNYVFPNDLDFDFNEDIYEKYGEKYDIYPLNCYIHDNVHFYIKWTKVMEMFDTSQDVGYAICLKGSVDEDEVIKQIERLNSIINWEVYDIAYQEQVEWTNSIYWTMTTWETYNRDRWLIGWDEVVEEVNKFMKWD